MTKKSASKGIVKDIIIVVVGVLVIWIGLWGVFGTQNPFYVVSSGSMIPVLEVYDVIVVQGNDPFESVEVGDIIVFNRPSGQDRVIVHRVASIIDDNPLTIRTKGDANTASIPGTDFPITEEEYIGKVQYVIPQVGYITRILTPPINYIIIAIIVGVMIFKQYVKKKEEKKVSFEDPFEAVKNVEQEEKVEDVLGFEKMEKDTSYTQSDKNNRQNEIDESLRHEKKVIRDKNPDPKTFADEKKSFRDESD